MKADGITADTALPSRFGGQAHYPQIRFEATVTMPGPDHTPVLFPTLCGNAYARRHREGETADLALCVRCVELRDSQHMSTT